MINFWGISVNWTIRHQVQMKKVRRVTNGLKLTILLTKIFSITALVEACGKLGLIYTGDNNDIIQLKLSIDCLKVSLL